MRQIFLPLMIFCFFLSTPMVHAAEDLQVAAFFLPTVDQVLERGISAGLISGGVVIVGNSTGNLQTFARGRISTSPDAPVPDENTVFDLASLTKVVATTPAIMKLIDEGRVSLKTPISQWFPEFRRSDRGEITVLNLLTHTSGLSDFNLRPGQAINTAIRKAAAEKHRQRVGTSFNYSDMNFILLAEIVHQVTGRSLDVYCAENLFRPLGTKSTMFLPSPAEAGTIAPTTGYGSGVVQDANARRLGGVAGHAGLFSSAADLARFARMILGHGAIDGQRILSEQLISRMTTPYYCHGNVIRSPGWDMHSPYSAPKGSFFSENSFGHTGYSGSSIWIDPQQDLFVVMLTTRLNYHDPPSFNQLRRDISSIAAAAFSQNTAKTVAMTGTMAVIEPAPIVVKPKKSRAKVIQLAALKSEKGSSHRKEWKKKEKRRKCSSKTRRV